LSIARAIINDMPILLVDEPTATLDRKTSLDIFKLISSLKGKTRIVITHQLDAETLSMFDLIYVIQDGRVVESGNYNELSSRDSYLHSMQVLSR